MQNDEMKPSSTVQRSLIKASGGFPMVLELLVQDWRGHGSKSMALALEAMTAEFIAGSDRKGSNPTIALKDFAAHVAEKFNVYRIEPWTGHFPSTDPKYANPENEVWLDFQTDAKGDATVASTVPFKFRAGEANAVVIHANHTATEPGKAGTAGDRLACITASFT